MTFIEEIKKIQLGGIIAEIGDHPEVKWNK